MKIEVKPRELCIAISKLEFMTDDENMLTYCLPDYFFDRTWQVETINDELGTFEVYNQERTHIYHIPAYFCRCVFNK